MGEPGDDQRRARSGAARPGGPLRGPRPVDRLREPVRGEPRVGVEAASTARAASPRTSAKLRARGIQVIALVMVGLDGDTPETFAATLRWLDENKISFLKLFTPAPYPGTQVPRRHAGGRPASSTDDWGHYDYGSPTVRPLNMTADEMLDGFRTSTRASTRSAACCGASCRRRAATCSRRWRCWSRTRRSTATCVATRPPGAPSRRRRPAPAALAPHVLEHEPLRRVRTHQLPRSSCTVARSAATLSAGVRGIEATGDPQLVAADARADARRPARPALARRAPRRTVRAGSASAARRSRPRGCPGCGPHGSICMQTISSRRSACRIGRPLEERLVRVDDAERRGASVPGARTRAPSGSARAPSPCCTGRPSVASMRAADLPRAEVPVSTTSPRSSASALRNISAPWMSRVSGAVGVPTAPCSR